MTTNLNTFVITGFILAKAATSCTSIKPVEIPENMNIVIFYTDDLGYGDLGCYGHPIIKTPNIDRFAKEGVLLTDNHSAGTVCSPSRAALLTGRNPYRSGFFSIQGRNTFLAQDEVTIPELLKNKGYETCFLGKWHLSELNKNIRVEPGPGEQGFNYWMGTTHNAFDGPENTDRFIRNDVPLGKVEGWYVDVIVEEAGTWLREIRDSIKPFFLLVSTHEPHTPVIPPVEYSEMYNTTDVDSLEKTILYGGVRRPERDISNNKKMYYGTVTQLDDAFGRLLEIIDELGLTDNTLIYFSSDNGPETPVTFEESLGRWEDPIRDHCFGTPGEFRGMKRYPYEGGHRVPGIVRLPGVIPAGLVSNKLFNQTDFLPTITALLDIPLPEDLNIDGKPNFNAFLNKEIERNTPDIWFYPLHGNNQLRMPQMSMRSNQYTLIGWLPEKPDAIDLNDWFANNVPERFELYDIINDPQQKHDLAGSKPEVVSSLSPVMEQLFIEMRDEGMKN